MWSLLLLLSTLALTFTAISCSARGEASPSSTPNGAKPIVVGSKNSPEGLLLAQIIIQTLKANGLPVVDRSQTGPTQVVRKALQSGYIDLYPEYTGNGASFFNAKDPRPWKDPRRAYEEVKRLDYELNRFVWLRPAPASNSWAIALPKAMAEENGIRTLEDFAGYVNRGGAVKLAASPEFLSSPVAMPAFEKTYGFNLTPEQVLALPGVTTVETEHAVARGAEGANAAMAYGTDGLLHALDLVVLKDTKAAQLVYEPAPVVRSEVYDAYPRLSEILDPVFRSIDLETLQALNARVTVNGEDARKVAEDYLKERGFLKPQVAAP